MQCLLIVERLQDWQACCQAVDLLQLEDLTPETAQWMVAQRTAWHDRLLEPERRLLLQLAGVSLQVGACAPGSATGCIVHTLT